MPLPVAWDTRQIKGTRLDFLGSPAAGTISFTPTAQRIKELGSDVVIFAKTIVATLLPDGTFLVTLPVSVGDTDITPNFQYSVLEQLVGSPDYKYTIEIPIEISDVSPYDIADLAPTGSVPTGTTALTQSVADLLYQSLLNFQLQNLDTAPSHAPGRIYWDTVLEQIGVSDGAAWTYFGSGGSLDTEAVQDVIGAMLTEGSHIDLVYDDDAGTLSIAVTSFTAAEVGLGSVNNTSDVNKPVSTAQGVALGLKAPSASPAFTGTPTGITKTHVGLGDVDDTSDADKPLSTAATTALAAKAALGFVRPILRPTGAAVNLDRSGAPAGFSGPVEFDTTSYSPYTGTISGQQSGDWWSDRP